MLIEKYGKDANGLVAAFALSFTLANIDIEDITDHFGIDDEHAEQALAEAQSILGIQVENMQAALDVSKALKAVEEQIRRADNAHLN